MAHAQSYADKELFGSSDRLLPRFTGSLAKRISSAVRRLQYGRMKSILGQMPDHHLDAIGIQRSEIAAYSHELIYGKE